MGVEILCANEDWALNISFMQEQYYDVFRMHDARCMICCYSDVDMIGASMHNGNEIYHDG